MISRHAQRHSHKVRLDHAYDGDDADNAPICAVCDEPYNPRRAALGYTTCLPCAHDQGEAPAVIIADVSKSNGMITLDPRNVSAIPAGSARSSLKSEAYMRLTGFDTAMNAVEINKDTIDKDQVKDARIEKIQTEIENRRRGVKQKRRK